MAIFNSYVKLPEDNFLVAQVPPFLDKPLSQGLDFLGTRFRSERSAFAPGLLWDGA